MQGACGACCGRWSCQVAPDAAASFPMPTVAPSRPRRLQLEGQQAATRAAQVAAGSGGRVERRALPTLCLLFSVSVD